MGRRAFRLLGCLLLLLLVVSCASEKRREIRACSDLEHGNVGVLTGRSNDSAVRALFPDAELYYFEDLVSMCMSLQSGHIDAFACMETGVDGLLARNPGFRVLEGVPEILDTAAVAFREDNLLLAGQFNEFLRGILADGTMDAIRANWLAADAPGVHYHPHATEGEPLSVGIEAGQTFFTVIREGEGAGLEPELMMRFGDYLGRPVRFVEMTNPGMIPALFSGKVDALVSAIAPTRSRAGRVLFSTPYDISPVCLVVAGDALPRARKSAWSALKENFHETLIADNRFELILEGLKNTLLITFLSVIFGFLLGCGLCWMKRRGPRWAEAFSHGYCEIVEGIPIVVLLLFMFYVVFATSPLTAIVVAVITYSLHFAAGAAECLERSIESVDKGQWEAGKALGFSRFGTFRYVIAPQAVRQFLPLFKGKAVGLIENTSIVGFIAIEDMTKVTDIIRSQTYDSLVPLVVVGVIYFLIARLISVGLDKLGDHLNFKVK